MKTDLAKALFVLLFSTGFMVATVQPIEIPAGFAWPTPAANSNAPGFKIRVAQADPAQVGFVRLEATSARAEAQLAGLLIDPATSVPYADVADKSKFNTDATYDEPGVIDYEQAGNATTFIPGIPEGAPNTDDFALEAVTFLDLAPGTYSMIVNSDDGFRVSAGLDPRDCLKRITIGEFEGGRSAADTLFTFSISKAGLYSFRLLYYEAGGGANVSWLTTDSDANRLLINDTLSGGLTAYRAITPPRPTYIPYVSPTPNSKNVSPATSIQIQIGDGDAAQLDPNSIELYFNNLKVAPTLDKTNSITTLAFKPTGQLPTLSTHNVRLTYKDTAPTPNSRTEEFTFQVRQYAGIALPAPLYFENFESTAEGALPPGWSEISLTDQSASSADLDFSNLDSAAYAKWTVVNVDRFRAPFITYSNPDNPASWENDYKRVLSANPANIVNDKVVTELAKGRFLFGNSGYRNGAAQVLYLFTPDFDLAGKSDVFLSFNSLWEQNQDSIAGVEYSINGGQTWLPILYMIEPADVIRDPNNNIDAVATLTREHNDVARFTDPLTGEERGGAYGAFIGAEITPALAPFINGRRQDDPVDSKRVELFRITQADNQPKVRFRFAHAGTDSWYFGIDNFGLYSIPQTPPKIVVSRQGAAVVFTWPAAPGVALQITTNLTNPNWQTITGTTGAGAFAEFNPTGTAFYRLAKQ